MYKLPIRLLISILTFVLGISVVAGWFYYQESQKIEVQLPNARWEPIFFKLINRTTELGKLKELRKINLSGDDIEIRVWRDSGDLEGVIIKRNNNHWSAFHVKASDFAGDYADPQLVEVKQLNSPKSGWDSFWKNVTEQGLLTLRDPSEINCKDSGLDGTSYIIEINQNKIYRTYYMRSGGKCFGVRQMEAIDDLIGEEFDSGREECKTTEWFACAKLRKSYRQSAK